MKEEIIQTKDKDHSIINSDYDHIKAFFPTWKETYTIKELAYMLNMSEQFIRDMIQSKQLFCFAFNGCKNKNESEIKNENENKSENENKNKNKRKRHFYLITAHSLLIFLLKKANFTQDEYSDTIIDLLKRSSKKQLECYREVIDSTIDLL